MSETYKIGGPILITASEIARIAGVGPSAVSNWRRRESDFPPEVEEGLFSREEVLTWLQRKGKDVNVVDEPSLADALWRGAEHFRSEFSAPADAWLELILQLVVLHGASWVDRTSRLDALQPAWTQLSPDSERSPGDQMRDLISELNLDDDLRRALQPPQFAFAIPPQGWAGLLSFFNQFPATGFTDWAQLGTAITTLHSERSSRQGAKFLSGDTVIDIMKAVLSPVRGSVYDPACGAGRFLAAAWQQDSSSIDRLYGQDVNADNWKIGYLNLLLQDAHFELALGDTLENDEFFNLRADRIALDPPFGARLSSPERLEGDPRWGSVPTNGRADLLWIQHAAYHLAADGLGVVATLLGTLFHQDASRQKVVRDLLDRDLLDAVIELPPGLLVATRLPCALLCLRNGREASSGGILFVDARQLGTSQLGGLLRFNDTEVGRIGTAIDSWRNGFFESEVAFAATATLDDIEQNSFVLSPNRYIDYGEHLDEIDGEPVADRLRRLQAGIDGRLQRLTSSAATLQQMVSTGKELR